MMMAKQKVFLCILDGWGVSHSSNNNGIAIAHTPNWDDLWAHQPHTTLEASELFVGLPSGQMGNSEVGHMTIGSGRVIMQELPRIDQAIEQQVVPSLPAMSQFIQDVGKGRRVVHLLGLLSPGGVHSHQNHLLYFARYLASQNVKVWIHAFMDGRDTPPQSGVHYLDEFRKAIALDTNISLATVGGRYFGMDRDKRWERIQLAYDAIVCGQGEKVVDPEDLMTSSYAQGVGDEFISPHVMEGYQGMMDGDGLLMVNFRADRVRQILTALLDPDFAHFTRARVVQFSATLGMTDYASYLSPLIPALFEKQSLAQTLGEIVAEAGLKQLRAAETEKYAHVTFFFNGGREVVFPGEDRILINSPKVATYDLQPEMSAPELAEQLSRAILSKEYDFIVTNFANPDMVGHTGVVPAIIKAIGAIDECLGKLREACEQAEYVMLITADHGNVEQMTDSQGQPHTAHTLNPVPFVVVNGAQGISKLRSGSLQDIAPTVLNLLGIPIPGEMTGQSLIVDHLKQRALHVN